MGIFGTHTGNWGTPELGATEWLSNLFGQGRTDQGGSNLRGDQTQTTQVPSGTRNGQANFVPLGTSGAYGVSSRTPSTQPVNTSGAGGTGGTGGRTGVLGAATTIESQQQTQDPYASLRDDISGGWDNFIGSLDGQLEGLLGQRTAQETTALNTFNQNQNTLDMQNQQNTALFGTQRENTNQNQVRTLRDLAGNLRNAFQAGNVYLGARGAGDSSASNQYSYALSKMGTQQRSDVMGQTANIMKEIDARETGSKQIYDTTSANLKLEYDNNLQSIASWFNDAQNQLKQMMAQGQLSKSQDLQSLSKDILNQAISQMNQAQSTLASRRSQLDQWAMGISNNVAELRANMEATSQYTPELPGFSPIAGTPTVDSAGNFRVPSGYGGTSDERQQRGLFG